MTLGIELLLAADVRIAATGTRFAQLEVQRGIYPFGGATLRLPREAGWGNAMRWLLTGDKYFASNAGADLAVVAARPEGAPHNVRGLALYLLPKLRADGSLNRPSSWRA